MILYAILCLVITLLYGILIIDIFSAWNEQEDFTISEDFTANKFISVIIAARNEEANIKACLYSILHNDYPSSLFEIIVVDDNSVDDTFLQISEIENPLIHVIRLTDNKAGGKKAALELGIQHAAGDYILVTDADCIVPKQWINFHSYLLDTKNASCITGPIDYHNEGRWLEQFQLLDLIGMMGVTQAGIFSNKWYLANGANMSFKKELFIRSGGHSSSKQFASGDDVFLIQAIAEISKKDVHFLKNKSAAVKTHAENSLTNLYNQRLRWATKNRSYKSNAVMRALSIVFLFCLSIIVNLLLIPFFGKIIFTVFIIQLIVKLSIDFIYLKKLSQYFDNGHVMQSFFSSSISYIGYIVLVGIMSILKPQYTWKGRILR